jgi:hypothetical protein
MGMVMMSPALLSLTEEAKITIINKLKTDNNFNGLVAEINKGFNAGRPLFDTTNTAMIAAFDKLFQTAAARVGTTPKELPVNMYSSGRNFTFQNSAKTYTTVIGVYKGNNFVENIVIDGKTFFSTSITDLLSGKAFLLGDPDNQLYKLDGDGDFTFKFRTGKPGFGDGSPQHDDAFYKNLAQFSIGLLSILSPEYISCFGAFRGRLYESIKNLVELNSNSNMSPANVLEIVWNFSVGSMKDLIKNCTNNSPSPKWLMWLDKFTSSLNLYSKTVSGANTTLFGIQWANSEAVIDTCFKATGSTVTPGGCDKACIDSTAIYEAACIGSWTVTNVESGDNQNLVLYENGGRYIVDGPDGLGRDGIDENGNSYYNISWRIEKRNCKYFLREDGYWHFAFEQSRSLDISLNNVYLTYPVSSFTTYNQFSGAPYPSRIYTKN